MSEIHQIPVLPSLEDDLPVSTWMDKLSAAIEVGVVGFFRQSTDVQKRRHTGSQKVQEEQLDQLIPFGVAREQVHVILAYGESAREGVVRKRFQELKDRIRERRVGLLVLARHDRLSRNTADADELFRLLVQYEVLVMVDGRIYDPSEAGDRLILGLYSQFAEYENRMRTRWMGLTRLAKAKALELRIKLPAGLVWADPDDSDYRAKAEEAGLSDWLENIPSKPCSEDEDRKYYILPYPDEDVATAIRLIRKWLLETRKTSEVENRIREGFEGYPHPGRVPVGEAGKAWPKARIGWAPTRHEGVRSYVSSPALYGCYRYQAKALRPKNPRAVKTESQPVPAAHDNRAEVEVKGAFRSWFRPDEQRVVRRILAGGSRKKPYTPDPQNEPSTLHAIGMLRCSMEVAPGQRCRRRIKAYPNGKGAKGHEYLSTGCRTTKFFHYVQVPSSIDEHVLEILTEVFRPESLAEVARAVRVNRNSSESGLRVLGRKLRDAQSKRAAAQELVLQAQMELSAAKENLRTDRTTENADVVVEKEDAVKQWKQGLETAMRNVRDLEARLREQERRLEEYGAVTDEELQKCAALASDLPGLIERVRDVPGALQRIVEVLTSEVWVRKLAAGIFELQVDFPSGESVVRVFCGFPVVVSQPVRVLASNMWDAGTAPEVIAREIARYPSVHGRRVQLMEEDRVHSIVLQHRHFENEVPRDGEHWSPAVIAARVGATLESVMSLVFDGRLGPARWEAGGLVICPTEAELHRLFPDFALREVARVHGLGVEELISASDVYRANRQAPEIRPDKLGRHVFRDAARHRYFLRSQVEAEGLETIPNRVEAAQARAAVEAAVAALGRPDLDPADFHPLADVVRRLGPSFPWVTVPTVRTAIERGQLPGVRCLGFTDFGRIRLSLVYVHAPKQVLNASSETVIGKWLPRSKQSEEVRQRRSRVRAGK